MGRNQQRSPRMTVGVRVESQERIVSRTPCEESVAKRE